MLPEAFRSPVGMARSLGVAVERAVAVLELGCRSVVRALLVGMVLLGPVEMAHAADTGPSFVPLPASGGTELQTGREGAVAASLPGGKVLIAGGLDGNTVLQSAELFDPSTDTFTALAASGSTQLQTRRQEAVAASLPGGKVLIAGGVNSGGSLRSAELFDPSTDTFTALAASGSTELQSAREGAVAAPLADGRVLIAGGFDGNSYLRSAELFDPSTDTFTALAASGSTELQSAREGAVAAPLADGRVLIAGGFDGNSYLRSAELFDPSTDTFTALAASGSTELQSAREGAVAAPLADGRVLIAGGFDGNNVFQDGELFDHSSDIFTALAASGSSEMQTAREGTAAAALPGGKLLIAGGFDSSNFLQSAELMVPGGPSASISTPTSGGTYAVDQSVSTAFVCADGIGGPGLSSCDDSTGSSTQGGGAGHLDTSTPGAHMYTVTATSSDGQNASAQVSYTVVTTPAAPVSSAVSAAPPPSASIIAPRPGRTYTAGQSVRTRFACAEGAGGPGLSSCNDSTGAKTRNGGSGHLQTSTPGSHTYTVTATSSDGQTAAAHVRYKVKRPTPRLSTLKVTPHAFPAATSGPTTSAKGDAGVVIRYRDALAAHSTFLVLRCGGSGVGCRRPALVGTFTHRDHTGRNSLRFSGRLHGHALAPGPYLLKVTAALAGRRSPSVTTSFVILTPPSVCHDPDHDGDCDPTADTAATPSCGATCIDFSNALYGTAGTPTFVLANLPQAQNVGEPLTLAAPDNSDPGQDFIVSDEGTVSEFIQAGLMALGMMPYDTLNVDEIEYSPLGAPTGLCVGVGSTPANGTGVTLQPCGVSAQTTWIIDTQLSGPDLPLISGATDSNFSDPFVLSTLGPGLPLFTSSMHTSGGGAVFANQRWGSKAGVL